MNYQSKRRWKEFCVNKKFKKNLQDMNASLFQIWFTKQLLPFVHLGNNNVIVKDNAKYYTKHLNNKLQQTSKKLDVKDKSTKK